MGKRATFWIVAAVVAALIWILYRKSVAQSQAAAAAGPGGLIGSVNTVYQTTDSTLGKFGVVGRVGSTILTHPLENYTSGNWSAAAWSAGTAGWSDVYHAIW